MVNRFVTVCGLAVLLLYIVEASKKSGNIKHFFLRDPGDGLCLMGDQYGRCGKHILWHITGRNEAYSIHTKETRKCLTGTTCPGPGMTNMSSLTIDSCDNCGAKAWNILGDEKQGYYLAYGSTLCVQRSGNMAQLGTCATGHAAFSVQFVSPEDIEVMSSDGVQLLEAVNLGDLGHVRSLLLPYAEAHTGQRYDANFKDWDGQTALMVASTLGHVDIANFLLDQGADVNIQDREGITALIEAASGGHMAIVKRLVESGADTDCLTKQGFTPLWLAVAGGHWEVVSYLLSDDTNISVDIDAAYTNGMTPLMVACAQGSEELGVLLVTAGADVNVVDEDGSTALLHAVEAGCLPLTNLLLTAGASANVLPSHQFTPLLVAAASGNIGIVQSLVEAGAEVDSPHPESVSALMYAAAGGAYDVVEYLLSVGADVNRVHSQGGSALIEACSAGNASAVRLLLQAGADVLLVDNDGVTALLTACSKGHVEIVRLLLAAGAVSTVNTMTTSGVTPLLTTAYGGHEDVAELLLKHGADVDVAVHHSPGFIRRKADVYGENGADSSDEEVEYRQGVTPLISAIEAGHFDVVKILVGIGRANIHKVERDGTSPVVNAIRVARVDIVKYLLEKGANPDDAFVDDEGSVYNVLLEAIRAHNTELAMLLISHGADVNYVDLVTGESPLHVAVAQGLSSVTSELLRKGANAALLTGSGQSCLGVAAGNGRADIVQLLLHNSLLFKQDVHVNGGDGDGTTPLMLAAIGGYYDAVRALLQSTAISVNQQNVDGHTALMFAYHGMSESSALLVKLRVSSASAVPIEKFSSIADKSIESYKLIVQALMQAGAKEDIHDNEGHVALDFKY